jgi:hypothetical protein
MKWCRSTQLVLRELTHFIRNKQLMKLIETFLHFRSSLCIAIVSAFKIQDPSTPLLTTLATSLLTSFNPSEVFTDSAKGNCSLALLDISRLSRDGFLQGLTATSQTLAEVISLYAILPATDKGSRLLSSTDKTVYPVETAVRFGSWTLSVEHIRHPRTTLHDLCLCDASFAPLLPCCS